MNLSDLPNELKIEIFSKFNYLTQIIFRDYLRKYDQDFMKSYLAHNLGEITNRFLNLEEITELIKYDSYSLLKYIHELPTEKEYLHSYLKIYNIYKVYEISAKYGCINSITFIADTFGISKMNEHTIPTDNFYGIPFQVIKTRGVNLIRDTEIKSNGYNYSLYKGIKYGRKHVVEYLLTNGFKIESNCLLAAAKNGNSGLFDKLLRDGHSYILNNAYIKKNLGIIYRAVAKNGNTKFLDYLYSMFNTIDNKNLATALTYNHTHIIEWASCKLIPFTSKYCDKAAKSGNLDTLMWLRERGCPWSENIIYNICKGGNILMLEYVRKCFQKNYPELILPLSNKMTTLAARCNHYQMLKYLIEDGCPYGLDVLYFAIKHRNDEMINFILELPIEKVDMISWGHYKQIISDYIFISEYTHLLKNEKIINLIREFIPNSVTKHGDIQVLDYVDKNIYKIYLSAIDMSKCNYQVLEWCLSNGIEIQSHVIQQIIKNNDITVFIYCVNNGYIPDHGDLMCAVKYDRVDFIDKMQHLIQNDTADTAARNGSLETLKYLYQNKILNWDLKLHNSANSHTHILDWLDLINYPKKSAIDIETMKYGMNLMSSFFGNYLKK
jgi:hypothetical protein